ADDSMDWSESGDPLAWPRTRLGLYAFVSDSRIVTRLRGDMRCFASAMLRRVERRRTRCGDEICTRRMAGDARTMLDGARRCGPEPLLLLLLLLAGGALAAACDEGSTSRGATSASAFGTTQPAGPAAPTLPMMALVRVVASVNPASDDM